MKKINQFLLYIILLLIVIYVIFYRYINITLMFMLYDLYAVYGYYWKSVPEYCSPMKIGFNPVMPLDFYADFNKAIFPRIPSGDNNINKEEIIKICDRNLKWLEKNGKIFDKHIQIEILDINSSDFKYKMINYLKNNYPFVIRGTNLKCFETMRFNKLIEKVGNDKVYMSPSSEESCPDNIYFIIIIIYYQIPIFKL